MAQTMIKHSAQRDAIKAYLMSTKEHPSAEMVYAKVKQDNPKISLGTVYRNLSLLVELGQAKKLITVNGQDRFDGNVSPHYHFICNDCDALIDLSLSPLKQLEEEAGRGFEGKIESHEAFFYGRCAACAAKATES